MVVLLKNVSCMFRNAWSPDGSTVCVVMESYYMELCWRNRGHREFVASPHFLRTLLPVCNRDVTP